MNKPENIAIEKIQPLKYEGYLWYADQERPMYIGVAPENKTFTADLLTDFPFVVEGALYCQDTKTTITIRWAESKQNYIITKFDANNLADTKNYKSICHTWLVVKDSQRKVKMQEVWTLEKDECANNWPSFRPSFWLFKGFKPI